MCFSIKLGSVDSEAVLKIRSGDWVSMVLRGVRIGQAGR